jgi:hypothetical protein
MALHISKPKLPTGRGYVLKTSLLQPALEGVSCDVIVDYWTPQPGHASVLWAEWWLPNENRGTTLFVRAGSLPIEELNSARQQLQAVVLPRFKAWLDAVAGLPVLSPELAAGPKFFATWEAGVARVSHTPKGF